MKDPDDEVATIGCARLQDFLVRNLYRPCRSARELPDLQVVLSLDIRSSMALSGLRGDNPAHLSNAGLLARNQGNHFGCLHFRIAEHYPLQHERNHCSRRRRLFDGMLMEAERARVVAAVLLTWPRSFFYSCNLPAHSRY